MLVRTEGGEWIEVESADQIVVIEACESPPVAEIIAHVFYWKLGVAQLYEDFSITDAYPTPVVEFLYGELREAFVIGMLQLDISYILNKALMHYHVAQRAQSVQDQQEFGEIAELIMQRMQMMNDTEDAPPEDAQNNPILEAIITSEDEQIRHICQLYWQHDDEFNFSPPVKQIADRFNLRQSDINRIVKANS